MDNRPKRKELIEKALLKLVKEPDETRRAHLSQCLMGFLYMSPTQKKEVKEAEEEAHDREHRDPNLAELRGGQFIEGVLEATHVPFWSGTRMERHGIMLKCGNTKVLLSNYIPQVARRIPEGSLIRIECTTSEGPRNHGSYEVLIDDGKP